MHCHLLESRLREETIRRSREKDDYQRLRSKGDVHCNYAIDVKDTTWKVSPVELGHGKVSAEPEETDVR